MALVLKLAESSAAAGGAPNAYDALAGKGPNYAVLAMLCSIAACFIVSLIANAAGKKQDNEFFYSGVVEAE